MKRLSLRLRVALALMALSISLVILQTVAVFAVTEEQEEEFIDQIISDEMASLVQLYRADPGVTPPSNGKIHGHIARGAAGIATLPEPLRGLAPGSHEVWMGEQEFHVNVHREGDDTLVLLYDTREHERRIEDFQLFLASGIVFAALVTVWLGFWVAGRLARPVTDLAGRVADLDPVAPQPPLAPEYEDPEVIALARALDSYQRKVSELLQRESEFTAYVSHEVRTPLTAIRTSCELLATEPALSDKASRRVNAIAEAVDRLNELLRVLLFLAREIPLESSDVVELAELAHEVAAPLEPAARHKDVALRIAVPPGATVNTHRPALAIALSNLVKNAVENTERGHVTIGYDGGVLSVTDTGPGIAQDELAALFEPYRRGANAPPGGTGLGLAIVKRVADRFHWDLTVASEPGQGTRFSIVFPAA